MLPTIRIFKNILYSVVLPLNKLLVYFMNDYSSQENQIGELDYMQLANM